jgi:TRAP-type mannitol/chloroaromatic compound transport system substrate-binding protein
MDRRNLLTSLALGVAAGAGAGVAAAQMAGAGARRGPDGAGAAVSAQAGAVRLTMVTTWPKGMPGLGESAERVAQRCLELSGGTLELKVYAAGELVGAFEVFDAVATGSADIYHGADYYWQGKHPAYPFFTAVPFGMTAQEQMAWLDFGGGQQLWEELAGQFGIVPMAGANTTHQMGGWFKRELKSLADMRGLKMRIPGIGGEMVRRLGGAAVAIPGGEIYQALQSGVIDAAEFVGPWNDMALGFYREAPFYYGPGLHEPGAILAVGVNRRKFESLSREHQAILRAACREANDKSIGEFTWRNAEALKVLREKHQIEIRPFPDDIMSAAARVSRDMWAEAGSTDALGRKIYESFVSSLSLMRPWTENVETRYSQLRQKHLGDL